MNNIAIHGFGRIGRSTLRAILREGLFTPVCIADIKDLPTLAALFAVDTNYGRWPEEVRSKQEHLVIGDREILFLDCSTHFPDWLSLQVEIVIDATGKATTQAVAQRHLEHGAKKVLVSAPSETLQDCDAVLVPGVNVDAYNPKEHHIISMAGCTTNALAPVVKIIQEHFGIKVGSFTVVHAYTNRQALTDQPMRERRECWSAAENIIPSSSEATKALQFLWPGLAITGRAYRVPVRTGSLVELNVLVEKRTSEDEVKDAFRKAAETPMLKGIMGVLEDEYASCRIVGETHSSLVDLPLVRVFKGFMISVSIWFDNEMGYSTRLAEMSQIIAARTPL